MGKDNPATKRRYQKKYYTKNKVSILERCARNRGEKRDWLTAFKVGLGCSICGESHPAVLEFHHKNPETKVDTIANLYRRDLKVLIQELEKCEILCANCHRKLHSNEQIGDTSGCSPAW